jgi:hypothetical protein
MQQEYNEDFLASRDIPVPAWIVTERGYIVSGIILPAAQYRTPIDSRVITTPMPGCPFDGPAARAWVRPRWNFRGRRWEEAAFAIYAKRVTVRFLRRKWRALKAFIAQWRTPK